MEHIQPANRQQIEMQCIDQQIESDNAVRFIDAFVDKLDLQQLHFQVKPLAIEGRPGYDAKTFLKLYIYGYLNGVRSSRRLEKECKRNIELHWLLGKLQPNYHSISDFRKQNSTALRNTFKLFVLFLKNEELITGEIIAVDGTKVRAHNSKKNNYNPKKIERQLAYIEERTNMYMQELEENDVKEKADKVQAVKKKIERLQHNKIHYEILNTQLQQCKAENITTICAQQEIVNSNTHGTTEAYLVTKFNYNKQEDNYTCPEGHTLKTSGNWHKKIRERDSYLFKKYRTPQCKTCAAKHLCTGRAKGGREIERSQYAEAVEQNALRYKSQAQLYRKRQEINEHIFGTIKRKWGYYYTNLKGLQKVNGEFAFIMMIYNMRRCITILSVPELIKRIGQWTPDYKGMVCAIIKQGYLKAIWSMFILKMKYAE